MSHIDELRDKVLELRVREKELEEQRKHIHVELSGNRAEQARIKKLLVNDAQTSLRLKSVTSTQSARGTIARMGAFTLGEAISELGWERKRVKALLDAMICEKPPALVPDGKLGHSPMFRYVGPAVKEVDPVVERAAAATEKVRDWVITQDTTFTPAECAAACEITRTDALRALRALQGLDVVADEGPTADMPIFRRTDVPAPDVAVDRPPLGVVVDAEPMSSIPAIQELIEAAQRAHAEVTASNDHFNVETLDGRRVHIPAKPQGRSEMLQVRGRLRRVGIAV